MPAEKIPDKITTRFVYQQIQTIRQDLRRLSEGQYAIIKAIEGITKEIRRQGGEENLGDNNEYHQ